MTYTITDDSELEIYITDGLYQWYIPKFRIFMQVDEPYLYLYWTDTEKGDTGLTRLLTIDYSDVELGYGGPTPSSAAELLSVLEGYQISAFGGGSVTVDIVSPLMLMGG